MSKIGLVIGREYMSRVRKKTFILLTILIPILVVGLMFLAMWLGIEKTKHVKVLVADPNGLCEGEIFIGQDENPPATFYFYEDFVDSADFAGRADFQEYDVLIALNPEVITNKKIGGLYREQPNSETTTYIRNKLELRLEEYFAKHKGVPLETYREIRTPTHFKLKALDDSPDKELQEIAQVIGLVFSIFIFIFILVYAAQVMRSVIEEKTSRVVEIIVSSIQPRKLMMGKIVAVGLVGMTQFLIWIILISVFMVVLQSTIFPDFSDPSNWQGIAETGNVPGQIQTAMETSGERSIWADAIYHHVDWVALIILFLIYFIGGYLLYGSLFAMIGSAVDSETDTQQLMLPVMMPLMFSYLVSIMIMGNPDGGTAIAFSHIPFSSPIVMLQRVATGTVPFYEVLISLALLIATFLMTTYLAGKIYRVGILMYGKKVSWKEIIKWIRY
ncbi:MAG: ABC transporter permease [Flavobacteriales bacterium]|nr:ABC transporter permease [Flavobacteriales bacterium]